MGILFRLLARLPLPVLHNLGALLGWLIYGLSPSYRRHFRENIAQAGCDGYRHMAVAEAGKTMCELPRIWARPLADVLDLVVEVKGRELIEAAMSAGKGVLLLTLHLGCFEITGQYCARLGPLTALYRRPKQDWLAAIVEHGRGTNLKLAPADLGGVRKLLKALKAGEAVALLPDQAPGVGEGEWAPFFGRPAYTMTLAPRLASTGATVLFMQAERLAYGAGYRLQFSIPEDDMTTPAGVNRALERLILRCPGQYLWGYNRYKGRPPAA